MQGVLDRVILVDNGSTDGSAGAAKDFGVRLLEMPTNVGFSVANDTAARFHCQSDLVLFLNSDAFPERKAIDDLERALLGDPRVGSVAPALVAENGEYQSGAGGFGPSLLAAASHFLGWGHLLGVFGHPLFLKQNTYRRSGVLSVGWVSGACMMVRRQAFLECGGFGGRSHMYAEDVDLCYRMRAHGWKCAYVSSSRVVHLAGATVANVTDARWITSLWRWFLLERGRTTAMAFSVVSVAGLTARMLASRSSSRREAYRNWIRELIGVTVDHDQL